MVRKIFRRFQMSIKHGAVASEAQLVCGASRFQPLAAIDLMITNNSANSFGEDFGSAARHRIHSGVLQSLERLSDADLRSFSEVRDLDHGEGLQVPPR